ncbi:MAG TPA: PfkB family carbohydrate kinase [Polyangiaceae bacterium]
MSELGVAGHVTRDLLASGERIGGAAAYGALAAAALEVDVTLATSAPDDPALLAPLVHPRIRLVRQPSALATTFELSYAGPRRRLWVRASAEPLSLATLRAVAAPAMYVGPVVGEVRPEHLRELGAVRLVLGVQGWLRALDAQGEVKSAEPSVLWRLPERADLVLSEEDHEAADALARELSSAERAVLVTRGARGVTCFSAGSAQHSPAPAALALDPTGAGDVFGVVYTLRRQRGDDRATAIARAQWAAARSVEGLGVGRLAEAAAHVMSGSQG